MASITFKDNPIHTSGNLPSTGDTAPSFNLVAGDLSEAGLDKFSGKNKILNIVPSLDTGVCAISAKTFNEKAGGLDGTVLINISADLPFAQQRFCESEKLEHIVNLSTFRSPSFGTDYGVEMTDGPLKGLLSRAVLVLDQNDQVIHSEQVPEITQEPDYEAALAALS